MSGLSTGSRLGAYEIVGPLGAGGMGEVFRARDTKLGRDIALEVLPEAFTADAERLGRFRREAHIMAALSHPNIGAIHGQRFLVRSQTQQPGPFLDLVLNWPAAGRGNAE
jgi:serine/threonine protein kinase